MGRRTMNLQWKRPWALIFAVISGAQPRRTRFYRARHPTDVSATDPSAPSDDSDDSDDASDASDTDDTSTTDPSESTILWPSDPTMRVRAVMEPLMRARAVTMGILRRRPAHVIETACTVCDADCESIDGVAYCGDGIHGIETCDDGIQTEAINTAKRPEVCDASCQNTTVNGSYCGDGIVQADVEVCDDGNQEDGDYCAADCSSMLTVCGDGILEGSEICDDGNESNLDGCLNNCTPADCGDGYTYQGIEACDDGNDSNNDACLNDCSVARCGDNFIQTDTETCDEGNTMTERCDYGLQTCSVCDAWCQEIEGVTTFCGDGVVQTVEACDLGDANSDAYGSQCKNDCTGPSSSCGDGIVMPKRL